MNDAATSLAAETSTPSSPEGAGETADPFSEDSQVEHLDDIFGFGSDKKPHAAGLDDGAEAAEEPAVGAAEGEAEGEGKAPSAEPTPAAGDKEKKEAEPAKPLSDQELELESLRAQVAKLTSTAKAGEEKAKEEPAAKEEPKQAPKAPDPVKIKLPDEIKNAIFSDDMDAASGAMDEMVSGILTQVNTNFHTLVNALPAIIQAEVEKITGGKAAPAASASKSESAPQTGTAADTDTQLKTMRDEYFKDYPAHDKPEIQPVLAACAQEMATQFPGAKWDARYRASLGARVTERLKALADLQRPSGAPANSLPAASRSAGAVTGDGDESEEIMNTLLAR